MRKVFIVVSIIILGCFFFSQSKQERRSTKTTHKETPTKETEKDVAKEPSEKKRSSRKGPNLPPLTRKSSNDTHSKNNNIPPIDGNKERDQELEEKRKAYFEALDEIDNPNVHEQIMLGEMAFDANEAESAYEHYLDIIDNHSDDSMAPFALYKFAWVQYNLGDIDYAIQDMELVLEWIETGALDQEEVLRMTVPTDLELFKKPLQ